MAKLTRAASAIFIAAMIAGLTGCDMFNKAPPPPPPPQPLTVGGSVSGLAGPGLILQLNGTNDLAVSVNGRFSFPNALAKGSAYTVSVKASPGAPVKQTCTSSQDNGNIAAVVNNVAITCVTRSFAVGGTVSGLVGKGLVLQVNGANDLAIIKNGPFIFADVRLLDGSDYNVAIKATPARQMCKINPVSAAFDTDTLNIVAVTCSRKGRR